MERWDPAGRTYVLVTKRLLYSITNKERAAAAEAATYGVPHFDQTRISRFHQTDNMCQLNDVWACLDLMRATGVVEELKMYNSIKYERKVAGPFKG